MTEHTVTVTETVESEEKVYTCDYCGLSRDAGELLEYEVPEDPPRDEAVHELSQALRGSDETIPDLHFHIPCLPKVVSDEDQAEAITLKSQYDRRSGDSLLFVVTRMSLLFYGVAAALWVVTYILGGWLVIPAGLAATGWTLMTLALSYTEACKTLQEFNA